MPKRTSVRLTQLAISTTPPGTAIWDAEVPGLGFRKTQAGSRSFVFQFRSRTGSQGKLTIGSYPSMTIDEARRIARQHRVYVDTGGNPSWERRQDRSAPGVSDYAAIYLGAHANQKSLSKSTIEGATSVLNRFILPKIGSRKLEAVTPSDIAGIMAVAKAASGPGQANRRKAVLSKMFHLAIRDDVVTSNPCRGVDGYQIERRWDHLSPNQVGALLSACDRYKDQHAANVVRLLLFTGARLREVLKADWEQFDLSQGIWTKPSAHTKSRRTHIVALPPQAIEILLAMKAANLSARWLFPGRNPNTHRVDFKRPWAAILLLAGIGHWRRHDLRRTTASFMLSAGEDLVVIGKTLGHTQMQTTLSYSSLAPQKQREGLSKAVRAMVRCAA